MDSTTTQSRSIIKHPWLMAMCCILCTACQAQTETQPVHPPAQGEPVATAPTTQPPPGLHASTDTDAWLDRIEQRAATIKTLHAKLRYDRTQQLVGDRQRRFGNLVYDAGPPGKFAVHFDRLLVDRRLDRDDRRYIFDGQWMVERYEQEKIFIKRQIAPPPDTQTHDKQPQTDPLALGDGPFVLPLTFDKAQLLKRFDVMLILPTDDDPSQSVHLHLTPKHSHDNRFTELDLWYDRETLLPVRARTIDDSENESVIDLTDVRVNEPIDPAVLDTTPPTTDDWRVEIKPWAESTD